MKLILATIALLLLGGGPCFSAAAEELARQPPQIAVDPALPDYEPQALATGEITLGGSVPMYSVVILWSEALAEIQPKLTLTRRGMGSTTALYEILHRPLGFGLSTGGLSDRARETFEMQVGYPPILLATSVDMLAVVVHAENPIERLTLSQLGAIFAETDDEAGGERIIEWGSLRLQDEWSERPISLHGRDVASATYSHFLVKALDGRRCQSMVVEHPNTQAVCRAVAQDKRAIGFVQNGCRLPGVKSVSLATSDDSDAIPCELEQAYSGRYPLARFHYLALNLKPGDPLDSARREMLRFVYSQQGQAAVVRDGWLPLNAAIAREQLAKVGIED